MLKKPEGHTNTKQGLQLLNGKPHIIPKSITRDCIMCPNRLVRGKDEKLYFTCTNKIVSCSKKIGSFN